MNEAQPTLPVQSLEGTLERITFQNEESGYLVARLMPEKGHSLVTVVGVLPGVQVGERVRLSGYWVQHSEYGRQFEVKTYTSLLPGTIEGIRKYLGSGMIKGVGPATAGRIVEQFGLDTLEIIEAAPHRLMEVAGIGSRRVDTIHNAWEEQKHIKEIMIFLQGHAVSATLAVRIYKTYGDQAMAIVQQNPYRLAKDIYGIGFITADKIARAIGIAADSPLRVEAGILHTIGTFSDDGHCFVDRETLVARGVDLLGLPKDACRSALERLVIAEDLVMEDDVYYLPPFFQAETGVAKKLSLLRNSAEDRLSHFKRDDWSVYYNWLEHNSAIILSDQQKNAVQMALTSPVSILTGGPGTGKSTIMGNLIGLMEQFGGSVLLAAPTGRAAKRLGETTGKEAKTIHRLLEYNPGQGFTFLRDRNNPLDADMIIIDEASMLDILLMNHLLKAIPAGSHLLLVGDVDQLPPVGAGNVLRDLIDSEVIPTTRLTTIYRQDSFSAIIRNAHAINDGKMPETSREIVDFFHFQEADPQKAAELLVDLVEKRIPAKFGFRSFEDIQVLCPMHRGAAGVGELNRKLQEHLNPPLPGKPEQFMGQTVFRTGDRVMQIVNDYDKKVFNGDLGRIIGIDSEEQILTVDFDGSEVPYEFNELDELVHAYAISVHKSQGSEFPVVVIPVLSQHYMMLQRNLLYTAVTRAKKMVVLVGDRKAVWLAVQNNRIVQRNTRLKIRIKEPQPLESSGSEMIYPRKRLKARKKPV